MSALQYGFQLERLLQVCIQAVNSEFEVLLSITTPTFPDLDR